MAFTYAILSQEPLRDIVELPSEEAFVFTLSLHGGFERELFLNGSTKLVDEPIPEGAFSFHDLRVAARLRMNSRSEFVQFYVPRESIDAVSDETRRRRIHQLGLIPGQVVTDPIIQSIASALLPSLRQPEQASQLFVDHMALATSAHIASAYGGAQSAEPARGGLAPWQERRAKEMLKENLNGHISLDKIAAQCNLSAGHFSRAFRKSTGVAPHQWLQQFRVNEAKELLRSSKLSLLEIALSCGFSDQSHFTRVVTQLVGVSPGAWRRENMATGRQRVTHE
jgi:AraC family transcriptional regulator